jgi:hypothetical protein
MIVSTIQQIIQTGLSRSASFIFADIARADFSLDALLKVDFPAVLYFPPDVDDNIGKSGLIQSSITMELVFLDKTNEAAADYNPAKIDSDYITPMRSLAREFWFAINDIPYINNKYGLLLSDFVDRSTDGVKSIKYTPTYNFGDSMCFGVWTRAVVPITEGITGFVTH